MTGLYLTGNFSLMCNKVQSCLSSYFMRQISADIPRWRQGTCLPSERADILIMSHPYAMTYRKGGRVQQGYLSRIPRKRRATQACYLRNWCRTRRHRTSDSMMRNGCLSSRHERQHCFIPILNHISQPTNCIAEGRDHAWQSETQLIYLFRIRST